MFIMWTMEEYILLMVLLVSKKKKVMNLYGRSGHSQMNSYVDTYWHLKKC
jgi:hypothetical protein